MSDPNQPADPFGTQPPSNPYEPQGSYPPGAYGAAPTPGAPLAGWGQRLGSGLIDWLALPLPAYIVAAIGQGIGGGFGALLTVVGYLAAIGVVLWNAYQGGATGYSIGKGVLGIKLIGDKTGQPIGGGLAIGRYFLHILDGLPCYLGYFWPLWDAKKQTFADKILSTVVIVQPKNG
jgi:uncharacterized RDD family membrane protein YckC